jgi:modification methylase
MRTNHRIIFDNATEMKFIKDNSVDLMVTSPPYPMIEMWDEIFSKQNPEIGKALENDEGKRAFELMNQELDKVWKETYRVLKNGGFACINIGDATRRMGGEFRLYPSHARILQTCLTLGFNSMPNILWRKQTNAPNKFMGSGVLPAGAYITLEHEFILILRKDSKRRFLTQEEKKRRQESAFFWEERNLWFSDVWEDLKGIKQDNIAKEIRERSGAYPFELPYRIINMFSIKGDTVLDPFLGTGTTMMATMVAGRNSVGIEIDKNFEDHLFARFENIVDFSKQLIENRLRTHLRFVQQREKVKGKLEYESGPYGFPVITSQETEISFDEPSRMLRRESEIDVLYRRRPTFSKNSLHQLS